MTVCLKMHRRAPLAKKMLKQTEILKGKIYGFPCHNSILRTTTVNKLLKQRWKRIAGSPEPGTWLGADSQHGKLDGEEQGSLWRKSD